MSLERWIRLIAGSFIIVSLGLGYFYSGYWLLFTLFVGINLFQSALTGFCPAEMILKTFGVESASCDAAKNQTIVDPAGQRPAQMR
jgi:hypothetical protein